ncbi:uncharacterized protein LOC117584101 [Drosophila guanche]|uniref:TATA box-binding protein-like protein 1 n=2 Tax=Drosophila guanche TaxID=7266 RepID=A0A3B0K1W2_DROGU|nr:uncharacterized protein LOC117584101 [Drosophila guanche]SPP81870.1 Hypothetical predicted protein [Drosophila guanche]
MDTSEIQKIVVDERDRVEKGSSEECLFDMMEDKRNDDRQEEPKTVDTNDKGAKDDESVANIQNLLQAMDLRIDHSTDETDTSESESDKVVKQEVSNLFSGQLPISMWDSSSEENEPEVPDVDINYDNIFEDVSKLTAVEKHLQLLYRPFSCELEMISRFKIYELCILITGSRCDTDCYPSVTVKTVNPIGLVKIYAGGKAVSTALTAESAYISLFKVVRMVEELDFKLDAKNLSRNIVNASFCMPFELDLYLLCEQHRTKVTRNCRTRPFITYNNEGENVVFAVFPTGFVLVLHSTKPSETRAAIAAFLPILAQYKDGYATQSKKMGRLCGDISYKLLWEHRLEEDKEGQLLYS